MSTTPLGRADTCPMAPVTGVVIPKITLFLPKKHPFLKKIIFF